MDEEEYKKILAENGVELPEGEKPLEDTEVESEVKAEDKTKEEPSPEPLTTEEPKEPRKRSIYDEYKDKKNELKTEKELREIAERERDDFKEKLSAVANATTPKEHAEAQDELEEFAQRANSDPALLREMRELFLKDIKKQEVDPDLAKDLQEFKAWKAQNSQVLEKQLFEDEFKKVTPTLKEMFPKISDDELSTVKTKLDEISHSKDYYDKEIDYVVFKNKDTLNALVSPKKRGMETKGRKEVAEDSSFEFDPNADYTKMSLKEREQWEKEYKKITTSGTGLMKGSDGKMILM
jgi:hypothetical protein